MSNGNGSGDKPQDANNIHRLHGVDGLRDAFDKALQPRDELIVEAWRKRDLPPRDFLFENVFSTTSRWMIIGETGVGKTLFGLDFGFAAAAGAKFLTWNGVRPCRAMYLDGEMPAETFKERIEGAAQIYGNVSLYGYNRDVLGVDEMPPLNKPEGQTWLWNEIRTVKPDLIMLDSIMSLLVGPMAEEETWAPVIPLIRQLSSQHIAQVWLHHTGHDTTRGFGTKTREWELDTVAMLKKAEDPNDPHITLEFTKARLRTPKTRDLFRPQLLQRDDQLGWTSEPGVSSRTQHESNAERKRAWLTEIYDELAAGVQPQPGYTSMPVRKVANEAITKGMIARGYLAVENGKVPNAERQALHRARQSLIRAKTFAADEDHIWRVS